MVHRRIFTGSVYTVVTAFATNGNARVIKHPSGETAGVMAHPAILCSGNMRSGLIYGECAVMACNTIACDAIVIEDRRPKYRRRMAKVAILVSGQMVYCRVLTRSVLAVVTAITASCHTLVIKHAGAKTGGDMAHGTIFCRRYMSHWLAGCRHTIVAGGAIIHDARVIKHGINKGTRHVAHTAVLGGSQMVGVFTDGRHTVVARGTVIHDAGVIKHRGGKRRCAMTIRAILRSGRMRHRLTGSH